MKHKSYLTPKWLQIREGVRHMLRSKKKNKMNVIVKLNKNLDRRHLIGKPVKKDGIEIGKIISVEAKDDYLIAKIKIDNPQVFNLIKGFVREGLSVKIDKPKGDK